MISSSTGESYSDLNTWGASYLPSGQSSLRGSAYGGRLSLARVELASGTKITGGGTFVVVGGQVPMSGQIALSYDDTSKSCRVSGWILHG